VAASPYTAVAARASLCLSPHRAHGRDVVLKSHYCGELRPEHSGRTVTLAGWVHRRRDHGGLIFLDMRDSSGIVQVVVNPQDAPEAHAVASEARNEYVLQIGGEVAMRRPGTENDAMPTGAIEVAAQSIVILNTSQTPPFYINEESPVEELLRLRYRYLDLRRERMHANLLLRDNATRFIRAFLAGRGFVEVETPLLANPTPEGARDYLVPSRISPGSFYALPQSPQQYKQILMVAGLEKYFQIAHCLRDEDLRADRQPEHTQIDLEWSFAEQEDVLRLMEELYTGLVKELRPDANLVQPFPRIGYAEAMARFGTDKPDLRYGLELAAISDLVAESEFGVFGSAVEAGGEVRGLAVPGGAEFSRRQIDELTALVQEHGAKGLVSFALAPAASGAGLDSLTAEDVRSPVARFFDAEQVKAMAQRVGAGRGDLMLFVAGPSPVVNASLDALRREVASRLDLADPNTLCFCFTVDFPLLAWNEEEQWWEPEHHMFTAPREEDLPLLESDPGNVRAQHYDLVCNGWELGSGSIRINRRDLQTKMIEFLRIPPEEAEQRYGYFLEAFEYGAPPMGGFGHGLDRVVALLAGERDIREVIAFPKTKSASDPMTGTPRPVTGEQLGLLGLSVEEGAAEG
jgi:aspartyl-tRNA synthetase